MGMKDDELRGLVGKVTPGPWAAFGQLWYAKIATSNDDGETRIAFMAHRNGMNDDGDAANAALIAMAPDLAAEVLRLRAERDALVAANAQLVARDAEAQKHLRRAMEFASLMMEDPSQLEETSWAQSARAWLGGAK